MEYGVVLPIQGIGQSLDDFLGELLTESQVAEEAGFDAVFLPEFHQARNGAVVSPTVVGAAILQATSTLRFGTAVLAAPLHHPLRIAEDALMLDWLSSGRFILGLGAGHQIADFLAYGVEHGTRTQQFEEILHILGLCFLGEPFSHDGDFFQIAAQITPRPYSEPRPPIWLGGHGSAGIDRAARFGDLWLADPQRHVEVVAGLAENYRKRCQVHGTSAAVGMFREAWITNGNESATAEWAESVVAVHRLYYNVGAYHPQFEPWAADSLPRSEVNFDLLSPGRFLVGDGEHLRHTVNQWRDLTGVQYLALRFRHPKGPSHEATCEALCRFGEEVISTTSGSGR
jgi:alkanesulfonate monooxygenase SsuD/methylene tetrahydromethanopterin reductase-like flavin-dependent oxidoreductase (luciferase family)